MSSSSSSDSNLATAKMVLSTIGSIAAAAMVVRTVSQDLLPDEFQHYLFSSIANFFNRFSSQLTMVIDEFDGLAPNQIYLAAQTYLASKISPNARRLKISLPEKEKSVNVFMERGQEVVDCFHGEKFKWILICNKVESKRFYNPLDNNATLRSEVRSFELTFHKKHKRIVLDSYLTHVLKEASLMKQEKKNLKIFMIDPERLYDSPSDVWTPMNLDHPATFATLAMESKLKDEILKDLERFVRRREYYRKVGKAWKRGYLLYGPPGTGKSSLIAAMANYLNFDVYDLELTELQGNSMLRRVLLATENKSILVVEDIDCTIELEDRSRAQASQPPMNREKKKEVTLSGLLNFVDGLWSSCGDERIIIFTTNHKDRIDPALLRPGRMDVHVHMSFCTPCGFRLLASNYLGVKDHELFEQIEDLIVSAKVTPAEIAEQLLKVEEVEASLCGLIDYLHLRKKESTLEAKTNQENVQVVEEDQKSHDQEEN